MAIDQINVVDSIGINQQRNEAQLIISDHLEWRKGEKKDIEHMYLLQEKINTYVRFIESGEIYTAYPKAKGMKPMIKIITKYEMNDDGKIFFEKIKEGLFAYGHEITCERLFLS